MTKPVNTVPPLPYPGGRDDNRSLAAFDQDIVKALQIYLGELARRANLGLSIDGTDIPTGNFNFGGFDITNLGGINFGSAVAAAPDDLSRHIALWGTIYGFSITGSQLNYNVASTADHVWYAGGVERMRLDGPTGLLGLAQGQIQFPPTQVPSTNANTLDDYEEGTWTPVLTFQTPGDQSIVHGTQSGTYVKIGKTVHLWFTVTTTTFTHTTATGALRITGLPFVSASGKEQTGTVEWTGIVLPAGRTSLNVNVQSAQSLLRFVASPPRFQITAAETTSGTNVQAVGQITYEASA